MIKPHITPGLNGYTPTAEKQLRAMRAKADHETEKRKAEQEAERFAREYLEDHPSTTQLTGYEIANPHLYER